MPLKMEIFEEIERENRLATRNAKAYAYSAKCKHKKSSAKIALSLIGQAILWLPILYGMLFITTII